MKILRSNNWIIILILIILTFSGCMQKQQKPNPNEDTQMLSQVPESLKELEKSIMEIINELDKDKEKKEETEMKFESSTEVKQEKSEDGSKKSASQESKEETKAETSEDKKWKTVSYKIEELHKKWNEAQPEIVKAGVQRNKIDTFSSTLNALTTFIEYKNKEQTLFYANNLYLFIADFLERYNSKIPPNLKRMSFFVRDAKYNGMINEWEKSKTDISSLNSYWTILKTQMKKDQEEYANKTEFSIYELKKVIEIADLNLAKIKSEIALENLKKLEESFQKE